MNQNVFKRIMQCDRCENNAIESLTVTYPDRVELSKQCSDHAVKGAHEWGEGATLCKRTLINTQPNEVYKIFSIGSHDEL